MPQLRRLWPFLLAAMVLLGVAALRGGEYDEYYSVFLVSGDARPAWPQAPFAAGAVRAAYEGRSSMGGIARDLRQGDVHPPLYFWALALWRRLAGGSLAGGSLAGGSLFRLRLLSVAFSLASLALLASIARAMALGPALPVLLTVLCYGFAYTGAIARDFALALLFLLLGIRLLLAAERRGSAGLAFSGGLALGAACCTNYLAAFTAAAGFAWLMARSWRRPRLWLAAALGGGAFVPLMLSFFLAQRGARQGQFVPFYLPHALALLARDQAGAILGGLPAYLPPPASMVLAAVLALVLFILVALAARAAARLAPGDALLCILGAAAPPLGLLALGAAFDNTPIELRYFAFGLPFLGLLLAAGLRGHPALLGLTLGIQGAAILGLAIAPATMQPAARLARAAAATEPNALVLLPFGNDGVGIPGPFIERSPDRLHIALIRRPGAETLAEAAPFPRVVIPEIAVDRESDAVLPELRALFAASPCWQDGASRHGIEIFTNRCGGLFARSIPERSSPD